MGVAFEYRTVHEGSGVALVGIADHIFPVGLHLAGDFALEAGGETAAAPPAQSGVHNLPDDLFGLHSEYLAERGIPVAGDVFADVFRVDEPAVTQSDAHLRFVKFHVSGIRYVPARVGGDVQQVFHLASLDDVLPYNRIGVLRFDRHVERVVGYRFDDGAMFAESETAGADDLYLFGESRIFQSPAECVDDVLAVRCAAARAAAHQDVVVESCHCSVFEKIASGWNSKRHRGLRPVREDAFHGFAPEDVPVDDFRYAVGRDVAEQDGFAAGQGDFHGGFRVAAAHA